LHVVGETLVSLVPARHCEDFGERAECNAVRERKHCHNLLLAIGRLDAAIA